KRAAPCLLRHLVRIIPRLRPEDRSAVTPDGRANRAGTRAAGALLPPRLFAAARDEPTGLGRRGSRAPIGHLHLHRFVQNRFVAGAAEHRARDFDFAHALARRRPPRHLYPLGRLPRRALPALSPWPAPPPPR